MAAHFNQKLVDVPELLRRYIVQRSFNLPRLLSLSPQHETVTGDSTHEFIISTVKLYYLYCLRRVYFSEGVSSWKIDGA